MREAELKATIKYNTLKEKQTVQLGSVKIMNILMNHPVLNYGYKVEENGKSVFFSGDHEPLYNIYDPKDDYYEEYESLINQKNQMIIDFIKGVDVLIQDSAYTTEEYKSKRGWGHGTFNSSLDIAKKAQVKNLYFTHYEPNRSDDQIDAIYEQIKNENPCSTPDLPNFFMAKEGLEIII
ncbi:beta-lactamase domain-containing protein [Candidatus Magnetoovum chiemensis]|nr:beta-lactamase domain-containing protein [Candidatus Magnetoovum chiemensis]